MNTLTLKTNVLLGAQKAMVLMVAFCILLNGLMPRFMLEYRNCGEMKQVFENQAVLFTQINSLTSFAVKIANAFLHNDVSRTPIPFSNSKKSETNTSSEYSLISTEKRLIPVTVFERADSTAVQGWPVVSSPALSAVERYFLDSTMQGIFLLLVLCLFAFARSDVFDLVNKTNETYAQLAQASWVFSFTDDDQSLNFGRRGELQ